MGSRALVALIVATPLVAFADDKKAANDLFNQAKAVEHSGDIAKACDMYAKSFALDPSATGVELNVADCAERQGHLMRAYETFTAAAKAFDEQKDARASYARERAAAVEKKLATVVVAMPDLPPGVVVTIDGNKPPPAREIKRLHEPGSVRVAATAPGRKPFERTMTLAGGKSETITVTLDIDETAVPRVVVTMRRDPGRVHLAYGLAAGAGAGLVATMVVGYLARRDYDAAVLGPDCVTTPVLACTEAGSSKVAHARMLANVSTGLGIASLAAGIAAGVVYFTAPEEQVTVVTPIVGPTTVGVALTHAF